MTETDQIILSVLAATDALWTPLRQSEWSKPRVAAAITERRAQYATRGVEWHSQSSGLDRLVAHRLLPDLEAAGLLSRRTSGGRTDGVMLTDAGDWHARELCAMPTMLDCFRRLASIVALEGSEHPAAWGPLIAEYAVAGLQVDQWTTEHPGTKGAILDIEADLMPALVRGWVSSASDRTGHVRYLVSDDGLDAALSMPLPVDLPEPEREGIDAYWMMFTAERHRMANWQPSGQGIAIPLPASTPDLSLWFGGWAVEAMKQLETRRQKLQQIRARLAELEAAADA